MKPVTVGSITFETHGPGSPPQSYLWQVPSKFKPIAPAKGAPMVNVEITSIDLERQELAWTSGTKHVMQAGPGTITAYIRLRGESATTTGGARLTEEERAQLLALTTAIEERLMREFGA